MIEIVDAGDGLVVRLFVLPKSSKNQVKGEHEGAIRLKITAPPVDGSANRLCIKYLSKLFKIPKSRLEIISGHTNRNKRLKVYYSQAERKDEEIEEFKKTLNKIFL